MTALGKLLRTTAFKLTLVYLTVFALFAAFLLAYFAWNTRRLITEQITETVDAEIAGLAEQYRQGGIRRLVFAIDARARRPGSSLYLLTTAAGEGAGRQCRLAVDRHSRQVPAGPRPSIAGSTIRMPPSTTRWCAWSSCRAAFACWSGAISRSASVCTTSSWRPGRWSLAIVVVLGLAGGFFVTRRVLKRVDAMTDTTRTIMQGDLHRAAAGRRHRRRARPAGRQPQRHAGAHRGAHARPQGGLRQHRARSQDAADAAAQPLRGGVADRGGRIAVSRRARNARSRNRMR